jgi:nicotinamidase-related amidase
MTPDASPVGETAGLPRSPELMNAADTALLVVDVQERLLVAIPDGPAIVWNIRRLLEAAELLGVARSATEQIPAKLGPTVPPLAERLDAPTAKESFTCGTCGAIFERWRGEGRHRVLVCGIETHVCILQTVLDLLAAGFMAYVPVDAVGSRHAIDRNTALRRMESAGVILTTTEATLFEWCETATAPQFKQISALAKEVPPAAGDA